MSLHVLFIINVLWVYIHLCDCSNSNFSELRSPMSACSRGPGPTYRSMPKAHLYVNLALLVTVANFVILLIMQELHDWIGLPHDNKILCSTYVPTNPIVCVKEGNMMNTLGHKIQEPHPVSCHKISQNQVLIPSPPDSLGHNIENYLIMIKDITTS